MSKDLEDYYYAVHFKSSTVSFTNIFHTLDEVCTDLKDREVSDRLDGEITIRQKYGWEEQERQELKRLKAKYEPESENA